MLKKIKNILFFEIDMTKDFLRRIKFQNKVYERISEINNLNYIYLSTNYFRKKNLN